MHEMRPERVHPRHYRPDTFGDFEVRRLSYEEGIAEKLGDLCPSFIEHVREHGILTPVALVYNRETGEVRLREGHHRWAIAELLDIEVPVRWFPHDVALRSDWWREVTDFTLVQHYGKDD